MGELTEQVLRFAHYALLLGLFGWTAFRLVGLRGQSWVPHDRDGHTLIIAAFAAPVVSAALMLASIAAMMGVPFTALDWPMAETMIVGTDIGKAFLVRATLLVIGLCALLVRHRAAVGIPIAIACFGGALMTLGWSGHAAATEGALGILHRVNNGGHLLAAGLWLGAIGWFLHLTVAAHRLSGNVPPPLLLAAMHRFAPLGVVLVAVIAFTGLINSQLIFGLEHSITVLPTPYGFLLAAKVILVGCMLTFGAHNAQVSRRHALAKDDAIAETAMTLSTLRRSLAGEFVLAISVIVLVAVLGMMSPMIV
jgi:putative copper resistance protein D